MEGMKLSENRLLRLVLTLAGMMLLLIGIGIFLFSRVNDLLNVYMQTQGEKQAETLSEITARQFESELTALNIIAGGVAEAGNNDVSTLRSLQNADPSGAIGLLKIDGTPLFGKGYRADAFPCIEDAVHGNSGISFCEGKGLMFCTPAFRGGNVVNVVYRLYPEDVLYGRFGVTSYGGEGRTLIADMNDSVIVSSLAPDKEERLIYDEPEIIAGYEELNRILYTSGSAAVFKNSSIGDVMLYAAEIEGTEFHLTGYVPKRVVMQGVQYISMMVILVFVILAAAVAFGGILLTNLDRRARESEKLREATRIAEHANVAKSEFLANMSHEIRTPINAVLGMNEMILRESSEEAILGYARNVESAGNNLLALINDILDFSKIESGRMEITPAPYQFSSVLNDVSNMISFRAREKKLSFKVDADPTLPDELYGDEVRIKQVITNILNNAVKYTNEGTVALSVKGEERQRDSIVLRIEVKDTGIGIRKEDLSKLFRKFERVDLEQNNTVEGTGLGLAITRNLLNLMNGTVNVESTYGKGSTFTIKIPQKVVGEGRLGDFKVRFERVSDRVTEHDEAFRAPNAHILVVDDTRMNLVVIEGLLKRTEISVVTASSGEEALRKAKEDAFDLILLDQRMPHMDGTETLRRIRAQEDGFNRDTPVICLTADAVVGARERYLQEGFTDYLSKPVDSHALETALIKYLPPEKTIKLEVF